MSRNSVWCSALVMATSCLAVTSLQAQDSIEGDWEGAIVVQGQEIGIIVHFSSADGAPDGTIDVPTQGASGLPLHDVLFDAPGVHFEMLSGPGLATFDGTVKGDSIEGSFTQSGISGTFSLSRTRPEPKESSQGTGFSAPRKRFSSRTAT